MYFHFYSLINALTIGFFAQELKFLRCNFRRKTRFVVLLSLAIITFTSVIFIDIFQFESIITLIYDIFLSIFIFSLMFLRRVDIYKTMQRASRKKEVKRLNIIFAIVVIAMLILPFIAIIIFLSSKGFETHILPDAYISYFIFAFFAYIGLMILVISMFAKKFYKHYEMQVSEDKIEEKTGERE